MRGLAFALVRRLLIILPVLWAVVTLVFLLIHIVPGDPARQLVGENATEEQYQIARELGLQNARSAIRQFLERARAWRLGNKPGHQAGGAPANQLALSRYNQACAGSIVYCDAYFDSARSDRGYSSRELAGQPVNACCSAGDLTSELCARAAACSRILGKPD